MLNNTPRTVIGLVLGLVVTLVVILFIAFSQRPLLVAQATATATKTATNPATATDTATATPTATPTSTPTSTSTSTSTPTPTSTATATPTATDTATATPLPPSATPTLTFTPVLTETVAVVEPAVITETVEIATTLPLTQTEALTHTGVITPVGTPTPSPTPVPRTVLVPTDLPDYNQVEAHLWFSRPFSNTYNTWGSYFYPYGTNGRGQYFWHFGIDIQNEQSTPIIAVGPGTVLYAGPDDSNNVFGPWPDFYGQAVVIQHDQQWQGQPIYSLYGHVSRFWVNQGQSVQAGDIIAEVGQLGVALGPHLHLEFRVGGTTYSHTRNPDLWVQPDPGFGVIAGRVQDYQGFFVPQQLVTLHRTNQPSKFWRQTFTYPDNRVNYDDEFAETFTFSDVPAGQYLLKTFFDGRQLTLPVSVKNGALSFVLFEQTEPPKAPEPPAPTPTEAAPPTEEPAAGSDG